MPEGDTLFRTAAGLRPYLVGRKVTAARTGGPGPAPQIQRIVGREIASVEALGKNLLVRFDNGLEIRAHLPGSRALASAGHVRALHRAGSRTVPAR